MKRCHILSTTEGCATNLLENSLYRKHYASMGYEPTPHAEEADVILINTCGYNQAMEDRATATISDYQAKFPGKEIVLAGCLPKINPKKIQSVFQGTVMTSVPDTWGGESASQFDREDFERLSAKHRLVLSLRPLYFAIEKALRVRFRPLHNIFRSVVVNEGFYLVTVAQGCVGKCTFCAIKRAKGKLRSVPLPVILSEFDRGIAKGFEDFWLLGDDIGCWGQDVGSNVSELLGALLAKPGKFSIVLNYLDPTFLVRYGDRLKDLLSDPRVICANIPLQSGSPAILKKMERNYDPAAVFRLLAEIKRRNPALAVKTNVMVGFPGETWKDFARSLVSVIRFDAVLAMKYSVRPHTFAAGYADQVPDQVKAVRFAIINAAIFVRHAFVAASSLLRLRTG